MRARTRRQPASDAKKVHQHRTNTTHKKSPQSAGFFYAWCWCWSDVAQVVVNALLAPVFGGDRRGLALFGCLCNPLAIGQILAREFSIFCNLTHVVPRVVQFGAARYGFAFDHAFFGRRGAFFSCHRHRGCCRFGRRCCRGGRGGCGSCRCGCCWRGGWFCGSGACCGRCRCSRYGRRGRRWGCGRSRWSSWCGHSGLCRSRGFVLCQGEPGHCHEQRQSEGMESCHVCLPSWLRRSRCKHMVKPKVKRIVKPAIVKLPPSPPFALCYPGCRGKPDHNGQSNLCCGNLLETTL